MSQNDWDRFGLHDRVIIITGAAGLLGQQHAITVAEGGGIPVLMDLDPKRLAQQATQLTAKHGVRAFPLAADITCKEALLSALKEMLSQLGRLDGLINNAAHNTKMEDAHAGSGWMRFENLPQELWERDLAVGLTGAFLCSQVFGSFMATQGKGVIVNIASDLSLISPDQRIYRLTGVAEDQQPVKPVSYSIVKTGLIGLTRYLATYWAGSGVRVNAISPGGIENNQPPEFISKLAELIPLGRMARVDEYRGAIRFLLSDASSYMTGANLVMDGGRTAW